MSVKYQGCKAINLNYLPLLPPSSIVSNYIPTASHWLPSALSNAITTVTSPLLGTPATHGLTQLEIDNAQKAYRFASDGRAYGVLQGTRPGTAGSEFEPFRSFATLFDCWATLQSSCKARRPLFLPGVRSRFSLCPDGALADGLPS